MSTDESDGPSRGRGPRQSWIAALVDRVRHPNDAAVRRHAAKTPFAWVYAIVMAIASFQIYADPLGFDGVTESYSQQLINLTLTGPLYPDEGRDDVAVALIEEDTLRHLGMNWPWPYSDHARVLDGILAYSPKAVAVDILFADPRDDASLEQLLFVIERYQRMGVPLYFVGSPNVTPPVRQELLDSPATIVAGTINLFDGVARQYPETVDCLNGQGVHCPSLAVRIYEDLYGVDIPRADDDDTALELIWGTDTHPINRKWMRVLEDNGQLGTCPDDVGILTRVYRALIDVDRLRSTCPHQGTFPVEAVMSGMEDADIRELVEDNVVFYGAKLEGSADLAFTPTNGLLAGVYVHAMALDNIIAFKGKPKRNTITLFGVTFGNDGIKTFVAAMILFVTALFNLRHLREDASTPGNQDIGAKRRFGWYGALFSMTLGSGLILYFVFGLSISNWIELVFITGLLFELLISSLLGKWWGRTRYALGI
jgi:CHASE2 domain-containing sensor protein